MHIQTPELVMRFATLDRRESVMEYNFAHFTRGLVISDIARTLQGSGIQPGERAPDFVLPEVGGSSIQLSALRGTPVLLHFGSYT